MELHEFMCPCANKLDARDAISNRQRFERYPSRLLMLIDREESRIQLKQKSIEISEELSLSNFGEYKPRRGFNFSKEMTARTKKSVLADFEDCRGFDSQLYLESPFNIFQYNRLIGSQTAVLWKLPGYYEPSGNIGATWGEEISDAIEFSEKIPKVYWRGALSGARWVSPFERQGCRSARTLAEFKALRQHFSRINCVLYSRENPEYTDFKFITPDKEGFDADTLRLSSPRVSRADLLAYKYILCPIGNDVSTQLYWILNTNSIAFREECPHEVLPDYFIKPWVHYVPIARNLADLREKFAYCEKNENLCRSILLNAKDAYQKMIDHRLWTEAENIVLDRLGLL